MLHLLAIISFKQVFRYQTDSLDAITFSTQVNLLWSGRLWGLWRTVLIAFPICVSRQFVMIVRIAQTIMRILLWSFRTRCIMPAALTIQHILPWIGAWTLVSYNTIAGNWTNPRKAGRRSRSLRQTRCHCENNSGTKLANPNAMREASHQLFMAD